MSMGCCNLKSGVKQIIELINAEGIETVRVVFVDQHGILRGKTIVASAIKSAFGYYGPRKDKEGNHYVRKMSDTEKSVFYSHLEVFKLVLKRNTPHFIVEHDGILNEKIDHVNVNGLIYRQLGTMILAAGYYTPTVIEYIFKFVNKHGLGLIDPPAGFLDRRGCQCSSQSSVTWSCC